MDTITLDEAHEILHGDRWVAVQEESEHRWYVRELVVFQRGSDLLGFYWDRPKTEDQEGMDEFDQVPVPVFPVEAAQLTITRYKPA